jgi:hypothetical protein
MENPDDYPLGPDMQTFLEEERKRDSSLAPKKRENDKGQTRHPRHKREQ